MEDKWVKVTVDQIKADRPNSIAMGPFGSRITRDNFVPKGVPVIRGNNLNDDRFGNNDFVYLTEQKADELRASNAFPDDIVITHRGTLGQVGIIPSNAQYPRYVVSQSQMKLTVDPSLADPHFVFYFFKSPQGQQALLANTSQTGVPAIAQPTTSLRAIQLDLPPLAQQRTIASILGALDDKIELNRQMNQTLEGIAQALFKSWFVDFDPVRAKMEGRDPGLPHEMASMFPGAFEDSDLGIIPRGWEVGPLAKIATLQTKTIHPREQPDRLWEHYSIPAFDKDCRPNYERGDTIKSGKYQVPPICVLASKLNPQFPRVWLPDVADPAVAICSTEFMPFVSVQGKWRPFLYEFLKSAPVQNEICSRATGSTGSRQRVRPRDIALMPVVVPPPEIVDAFSLAVVDLHSKVSANQNNASWLARIRDTLLPKLLSGELSVKDFENRMEALL